MTPLFRDAQDFRDQWGTSAVPMKLTSTAKKPLVKWSAYADRLPIEDEHREWFGPGSKANGLAIITNERIGVRDFDSRPAFDAWRERHPRLTNELPLSRTLRGVHVWFEPVLRVTKDLGNGEYRAGRTLNVAPHSMRPVKGGGTFVYEWVKPLPKGRLPRVDPDVFFDVGSETTATDDTGKCRRDGRSHFSAVSAISAVSAAVLSPHEVIERTQPKIVGERNAKLLDLARGLKFNCGLAVSDQATLRGLVREWHTKALPIIGTKDFVTTWMDFDHAWEHARYPLGMSLVDEAAASLDPDDLPDVAMQYPDEPTRKLVALCRALGSMNAGRFFLSSHDAASRLDVQPKTAWRMLRMLTRDGVIEATERGNERRATRYRWVEVSEAVGGRANSSGANSRVHRPHASRNSPTPQ